MSAWRIIVSPYDATVLMARIDCEKCRQSMTSADPDAVFRHCGRTDSLNAEQRDILAGRAAPPAEAQMRADAKALERAKNQAAPPTFDTKGEYDRQIPFMNADAEAFAAAKRAQELYERLHPTPRQHTGPVERETTVVKL